MADEKVGKKSGLDDEMLPDKGEPVRQKETGGDERDTAGQHGDMAPETAEILARRAEEGTAGEKKLQSEK